MLLTDVELYELLSGDCINIYIAGKVTGDANFKAKFNAVAEKITENGHNPLNPGTYPAGLTQRAYMHLSYTLIDEAQLVVFLPDYLESRGAMQEEAYSNYTDKPTVLYSRMCKALEYIRMERGL